MSAQFTDHDAMSRQVLYGVNPSTYAGTADVVAALVAITHALLAIHQELKEANCA